jgi:hypothetical protein
MKYEYGRMLAIASIVVVAAGAAWAQDGGFALSVKPGMVVNGAHFGYKSDALFVGVGLEFASVGLSSSYEYTYKDTWGGHESTYSYKGSSKTDVSVFLPQLALKAFLGGVGDESSDGRYARPYVWGSLFYSIASARVTGSSGDSTYQDTLYEREIRDILGGNLGGAVALGGEYYIAKCLSLSAEFGARFLFGGTKGEQHYSGYYQNEIYKYDNKLGLGFTYTTLGLNFYF